MSKWAQSPLRLKTCANINLKILALVICNLWLRQADEIVFSYDCNVLNLKTKTNKKQNKKTKQNKNKHKNKTRKTSNYSASFTILCNALFLRT